MKALGVDKAASALKRTSKTSAAPAKRKREPVPDSAPSRRSSRARAEVSYKEPTMREFEEAFAVDTSAEDARAAQKSRLAKASRSGYAPNAAPAVPFAPSLDVDDGELRDKRTGALLFKDHPSFAPNLTPKQVIQAGSWGGVYFNPRGGKAGIKGRGRDARGVSETLVRGFAARRVPRPVDTPPNGTSTGSRLGRTRRWGGARVDHRPDPRGWFQWYCRFSREALGGRRAADLAVDGRRRRQRSVENQPGKSACTRSTTNPCRP